VVLHQFFPGLVTVWHLLQITDNLESTGMLAERRFKLLGAAIFKQTACTVHGDILQPYFKQVLLGYIGPFFVHFFFLLITEFIDFVANLAQRNFQRLEIKETNV